MLTIIIDGNNLAHRAKHVFSLSNKGKDVSVVYGFLHTMQSYIRKFKPTACIVCWDGGTPEFRRQAVQEYKANRDHSNDDPLAYEDFLRQMHELCDYAFPMMGIVSIRKPGAEADDLMYHASRVVKGRKIIITSDKDLFQAISVEYQTTVYNPARDALYDNEKFEAEYGIPVSKYLDWKAMIGDNSDNIPGVYGVGEKTATKLLTTFGELTNIVNRAQGHPVDKSLIMSDKIINAFNSFGFARIVKNIYVMALWADRVGARHTIITGIKAYHPADKDRMKRYLLRNAFVSLMEEFPAQLSRLSAPVITDEPFRMPIICAYRSPVL